MRPSGPAADPLERRSSALRSVSAGNRVATPATRRLPHHARQRRRRRLAFRHRGKPRQACHRRSARSSSDIGFPHARTKRLRHGVDWGGFRASCPHLAEMQIRDGGGRQERQAEPPREPLCAVILQIGRRGSIFGTDRRRSDRIPKPFRVCCRGRLHLFGGHDSGGLSRLAKTRGLPFLDGAAGKIQAVVDARRLRESELRIIPPAGESAAIYAEFSSQLRCRDENFAIL